MASDLPVYLAALCTAASHHHPSGEKTGELPDYLADYADEVGGDVDRLTFDTLSALCRDVACLDTSVADAFSAVKARTLVQGLLKGHTILLPYEGDPGTHRPVQLDGRGVLECGLLVGAVFGTGSTDEEDSTDEDDDVMRRIPAAGIGGRSVLLLRLVAPSRH